MSLAQPALPDRRPSPGLTLNLSSNNPFRNRAASPAFPSPALPSPRSFNSASSHPSRPVSRNPFLAPNEEDLPARPHTASNADDAALIDMSEPAVASQQKKPAFDAAELFDGLTLEDKGSAKTGLPPAQRPPTVRSGTQPPSSHRPSRSSENEPRHRPPPGARPRPQRPTGELDIFASPERRENRRPRRNSESSVMNKSSRSSLASEEEKKRKERRRRREAKERSNRVVYDVIDKLDVTGIYGTGVFHHDGPFDACNPHRNRRRDNRAPMQAFPEGSANNALGGSGPLNKNIDLNQFHGRGAEGFTDYATSRADDLKVRPSRDDGTHWNPKGREYVHGEESVGLGTSTFLEGTAASRTAIQRRESESEGYPPQTGGIQRKKSLAQRFRGISQSRRPFQEGVSPGGRVTSPDARYESAIMSGTTSPGSPPAIKSPQSAGGALKMYEKNPFFNDYDEAYDKKGATIKQTETEVAKTGRARAPSSPMRGVALERRMTTDAATGDAAPEAKVGGGFLNRVKSLKGGRRSRPERRAS